jgi:hypothetical protein
MVDSIIKKLEASVLEHFINLPNLMVQKVGGGW